MNTFDIIIGNPPFQKDMCGTFYQHFVYKAIELLKYNGHLLMITNSTWSTSFGAKKFRMFLLNNGLTAYYQMGDDAFDNVQLLTCYFHLIKGIKNDTIYIEDGDGESTQINDEHLILRTISQTAKDILYKLSLNTHCNMGSRYTQAKVNYCNIIHDPNGIKCIFSCGRINEDYNWGFISKYHIKKLFNKKSAAGYGEYKLVISTITSLNKLGDIKFADKTYCCSRGIVFLKVKDRDEAMKYKNYLESKVIKFIVHYNKINTSHNSKSLFYTIPDIPTNIMSDENEIYKHFKLTKKEIEHIEEIIK